MLTVRLLLRDRRFVFGASALALLVIFLWLYPLRLAGIAEPVFLHSSVHFGIDLAGSWTTLFAVAGGGTVIALAHGILATVAYARERETGLFAIGSGIALLALLAAAMMHIVGLNT